MRQSAQFEAAKREELMSLARRIADWIREQVKNAGAEGVVVGLSGGVDSSCVGGLSKMALGREAVLGVLMPCHSDPKDAEYAAAAAKTLGLETVTVDLTPVYDSFVAALPPTDQRLASANLKTRLRMTTLYYISNSRNYLVAGSGNRSELMVGYFTKYGDGGVDLLPLGDLYKREVFILARELGVPKAILDRQPSAGLWPGQTDEEEMGLTYAMLERALIALTSGGEQDVDQITLDKVRQMIATTSHKRTMPPVFVRETQ
jgi:NAD+ synthase